MTPSHLWELFGLMRAKHIMKKKNEKEERRKKIEERKKKKEKRKKERRAAQLILDRTNFGLYFSNHRKFTLK